MTMTTLDTLPDHARVWVFTVSETLTAEKLASVEAALTAFIADWKSHGAPVRGGFALLDRRFIIVAADEASGGVSGCSIDGMFHAVSDAVRRAGATLADTADIAYRGAAGVELADRPTFRRLVREGRIGPETPVFDNAIRDLGDLRAGKRERPFAQSWHAEHFAPAA
ncbi:MAG: hypothetical protein CFK52_01970 [Chloracidobacterium sp. CP2_5A]|nr:MAG: hypothetical protein CFK52_01970 [Chloracidobacterium sp. CP2_5A]